MNKQVKAKEFISQDLRPGLEDFGT